MLWISDPKALQYIFQTSGYNFPKQPERRVLSRLVGDTGLTWADGELLAHGGGRSKADMDHTRRDPQTPAQGHAPCVWQPGVEGVASSL